MDIDVIRLMCSYLIENVNNEIRMDELESIFHYNKYYLIRKFKEYTGYTPIEFVNELRVYNSTDSLIFTDDTILKIALNNGFNSLEYYSEKFRGVVGISPTVFRKVYSGLLYIAQNSTDSVELEFVKEKLKEISEYRDYLNEMVNTSTFERPVVKVLTSSNYNVKAA